MGGVSSAKCGFPHGKPSMTWTSATRLGPSIHRAVIRPLGSALFLAFRSQPGLESSRGEGLSQEGLGVSTKSLHHWVSLYLSLSLSLVSPRDVQPPL